MPALPIFLLVGALGLMFRVFALLFEWPQEKPNMSSTIMKALAQICYVCSGVAFYFLLSGL